MFARNNSTSRSSQRVPAYVWRGEKSRSLEQVKLARGFYPRGQNKSVNSHILEYGDKSRSAYVSFSAKFNIAASFAQSVDRFETSSIYLCNTPAIFIDFRFLPKYTFKSLAVIYSNIDTEIACYGNMPTEDIFSTIIKCDTQFISRLNPDYQFRNWSIEILSAEQEEQENIQDILRYDKTLAEEERYFSANEADELSKELKKQFGHMTSKSGGFLLFDRIPRKSSSQEAITLALREYYNEMRNRVGVNHLQKFCSHGTPEQVKAANSSHNHELAAEMTASAVAELKIHLSLR